MSLGGVMAELESKMARKMRCFTIERLWSDEEVRSARRRLRAGIALCSRYVRARLAIVRTVMVV